MGEGRRLLDLLLLDDEDGACCCCDFLTRFAARMAAVVEPVELAKSAKPRNPVLLIVVLLLVSFRRKEIRGEEKGEGQC